ncbi:MAG: VOC family protein [Planctomycetota bacterium]|jgi:uncharacterized glyoxalase superfamily protein PhnB
MQRVIPYLLYADAAAALAFLCRAFGFEEREKIPGPDGTLVHAEVGYRQNVVMLATAVGDLGHASPRDLPDRHALIVCYVDDVDAHCVHAKAAGAEILAEPEDQFYGDRTYRARDPEGHEWYFHTHVRDVPPEELQPPGA